MICFVFYICVCVCVCVCVCLCMHIMNTTSAYVKGIKIQKLWSLIIEYKKQKISSSLSVSNLMH